MTMPRMQPLQRRPRPPTRYRRVQVRRIERVTPRLARVTFGGNDMEGFAPGAAADSIKVTFPVQGEAEPTMPTVGPNGTMYTPGQERQPRRAYTVRTWDPLAAEFDIDIVLHGHGPGARWASEARVGDALVVGEPRGAYKADPATPWLLLAGDEAALPAISTILRELAVDARVQVYVEVFDHKEEQPLSSPAKVDVAWLHRESDAAPVGKLLRLALCEIAGLPKGPGRIWLACEAAAMRDIRKHFLVDLGVDRAQMMTQGYWKAGIANHSDHDWGAEI